jgi:hypothetical protein
MARRCVCVCVILATPGEGGVGAQAALGFGQQPLRLAKAETYQITC